MRLIAEHEHLRVLREGEIGADENAAESVDREPERFTERRGQHTGGPKRGCRLHALAADLDSFFEALGQDYQNRVEQNMVMWIRRYVGQGGWRSEYNPAEFAGRPIDWTIGGLTPAQFFFGNVLLAVRAGVPISWLPCRHAPHLTIPNEFAAHVRATTLRYLE